MQLLIPGSTSRGLGASVLAAWFATTVTAPVAHAQDVDALRLRSLAATCAACHGSEGRAVPGSVVPGLAGRPVETLRSQLFAYKHGTLPATVMPQIAKGYSDDQLDRLAIYFAAVPAEATR